MFMRVRSLLPVALLLFAFSAFAARYDVGGPRSTSNDDSCDISELPAATLLLPYFEVDLGNINGETTLFTVTNVTELPQIARVTLWTDLAVPLVSFNVFLTGYDVQAINLRDVLTEGRVGNTGTGVSTFGPLGRPSNTGIDVRDCVGIAPLSRETVQRLQRALTEGKTPGCDTAGRTHANAVGYATVDVVGTCSSAMPVDPAYFNTDIRWDNVLTGDYQQVNPSQNFAQGGPMVHIRAIPDGGQTPTNLTRTFYGSFTSRDARQPLPSRFAARWIDGGTTAFQTDIKIWRNMAGAGPCPKDPKGTATTDQVVFDEAENAVGHDPLIDAPILIPAAGRFSIADHDVFGYMPHLPRAGWLYFDLNRPGNQVADQAWMITSMRAENRYSADMNATAMGNGCSPPALVTSISANPRMAPMTSEPLNPSRNGTGIHPTGAPFTTNNDDSCDLSTLPAATLLLPYFEVGLQPGGPTTLFTVVNVTNVEQVARVTLWTDYGYPVITFNIYLTGYDVQPINLFDVIVRGIIAPDAGTGTAISRRSSHSTTNPDLNYGRCDRLPGLLDPVYVNYMRSAFTQGRVPALGSIVPACDAVGGQHARAVGYATIDVVGSCGFALPTEPAYFTSEIRYDNVFTGDYQQIDNANNSAQSSPMVHIRAVPEGGTATTRQSTPALTTNLERTFYGRLTNRQFSDARQPLPSTFAARWISGGPDAFNTFFKIWREPATGSGAPCSSYAGNAAISTVDVVVFDEAENFVTSAAPRFPSASVVSVAGELPQLPNGALAGWTFLNLDRLTNDQSATQNWVTVSMRAQNRFSVDQEATPLGNGCSPEQRRSRAHGPTGTVIGPAQ